MKNNTQPHTTNAHTSSGWLLRGQIPPLFQLVIILISYMKTMFLSSQLYQQDPQFRNGGPETKVGKTSGIGSARRTITISQKASLIFSVREPPRTSICIFLLLRQGHTLPYQKMSPKGLANGHAVDLQDTDAMTYNMNVVGGRKFIRAPIQ